jgi:hypothetical protein
VLFSDSLNKRSSAAVIELFIRVNLVERRKNFSRL